MYVSGNGAFFIRLHNGNTKHLVRIGAGKIFRGKKILQPLPNNIRVAFCEMLFKLNFTQV